MNMIFSWLWGALSLLDHGQDYSPSINNKTSAGPKIILVEGNIGSGKSSFLDIMSSWPGVEVFTEPVDLWRNVSGVNLFEKMNKSPERWMATFQLYSTLTRTQQMMMAQKSKSPTVMIERSLFSERFCFVEMLKDSGLMKQGEVSLLDFYFRNVVALEKVHVDKIVYIKSDPTILSERINKRGRKEEDGITFEYLRSLHEKHQQWLEQGMFPLPAPVETLDGNLNLDLFTQAVYKWAEQSL